MNKWAKLNDKDMNRVRTKMEKINFQMCECLALLQRVPVFNSDDVAVISQQIDSFNKARAILEKSYKAKLRPENWSK